jgi:hypothetical protein
MEMPERNGDRHLCRGKKSAFTWIHVRLFSSGSIDGGRNRLVTLCQTRAAILGDPQL